MEPTTFAGAAALPALRTLASDDDRFSVGSANPPVLSVNYIGMTRIPIDGRFKITVVSEKEDDCHWTVKSTIVGMVGGHNQGVTSTVDKELTKGKVQVTQKSIRLLRADSCGSRNGHRGR